MKFARYAPSIVKSRIKKVREFVRRASTPALEASPDAPDLFHVYRSIRMHPEVERKPGGWFYKGGFPLIT